MILWAVLVLSAGATLAQNTDKILLGLQRLTYGDPADWIALAILYLGIKAIHELGHILAYRNMCLRENVDPGPIRVGIVVFAAMPFPFTDVTGAWRISSRWRRAMIGAAGIYYETFAVAGLILLWATADLGVLVLRCCRLLSFQAR